MRFPQKVYCVRIPSDIGQSYNFYYYDNYEEAKEKISEDKTYEMLMCVYDPVGIITQE